MGLVAAKVWQFFNNLFGIMDQVSGVSAKLASWFFSHRFVMRNHVCVIIPLLVLWFMWRTRNQARYKGSPLSANQVIFQVCNFMEQMHVGRLLQPQYFKGDADCICAKSV